MTVVSLSSKPVRIATAETPNLSDVHVERRTLDYGSGDVVGVPTAINNTNLTDVSVDDIVRLETIDKPVVQKQTTTVLLGAVSVTTGSLSLSRSQPPAAFAVVNVTVTPSG